MKPIAYRYLAAVSILIAASRLAIAETRPHYGGTLRMMMQAAPEALELPINPTNATPPDYWDAARALSLIGDTLVKLDARARPEPGLAVAWQSDASARHWQFTLRRGVKFHDGSAASPAAIAQILSALHPQWNVRASEDSVLIESESGLPSLLAELALPRNLLLKRNASKVPIGTGAFLVAEFQPGKRLRLVANEESWAGRPFPDAIEIEYGKSLRDQAIALELDKADLIEEAPQASYTAQQNISSTVSLPVELVALVFTANSKVLDPRLREALALAIDRKPIQSVLLKGAGEPAASILPNWMTGYAALFSAEANPQRARMLLADLRQPSLNLSYDPRDPQAQLIAERTALNAREVGLAIRVSLSGSEDGRLMRIVLPSPEPGTSLVEAARQLGVSQPSLATTPGGDSLEDLYRAERGLLDGYTVIPLFHLPVASGIGVHVRRLQPDESGQWNGSGPSLADVWLSDQPSTDSRADSRADSRPAAGSR
jgi:peptide/nickel transport system substrate-binding protein